MLEERGKTVIDGPLEETPGRDGNERKYSMKKKGGGGGKTLVCIGSTSIIRNEQFKKKCEKRKTCLHKILEREEGWGLAVVKWGNRKRGSHPKAQTSGMCG